MASSVPKMPYTVFITPSRFPTASSVAVERKKAQEHRPTTAMVYRDGSEIPVKRFVSIENETTTATEQRREDAEAQESKWSGVWRVALTVGAVAGSALLAWGVDRLLDPSPEPGSGEEKDKKKMKQPGRKGKDMYRDDFTANPSGYFRDLRTERKISKK